MEFEYDEGILFKDCILKLPDKGGNGMLRKWYGTVPSFGKKTCP